MQRLNRLLTTSLALVGTTAFAGGPPNDDCSTPTAIFGDGFFSFDTTNATTGIEGQFSCSSPDGVMANDVWFCWTAGCTGTVTISTCGLTQIDTRINFWQGCDCPEPGTDPLCCGDNECDLQTEFTCDVVCGREYMIQIGQRADGTPGGPGEFLITCEGECPNDPPDPVGPCEIVSGQCCFGRPMFDAPDYLAFGGGPVGAITASPTITGGQVLTVYDFTDFSAAIPGMNFPATRYSAPNWTQDELGSIFGITLDAAGNIYVTPSIVYFFDLPGIGTWGDVYRIDAVTGAVSIFTTAPLPNAGEGLGNIVYDCENDQFFVTNFSDGLIYRLDAGGNVLSTFDHGTPDNGAAGIAPLGDRPWGVTVHDGKVFYGVWSEDSGRPSGSVNMIYSIDLVAGDFSGTEQIVVGLPTYGANTWSNPPSDLRFGPQGHLYVAERSMVADSSTGAHTARLLEFECLDGTWAAGADYRIGVIAPEANSTGGVDVDYRATDHRVWTTADALQFNPMLIYGAQGTDFGGGSAATSVLLDYQGIFGGNDKSQTGDIAISCPVECGEIIVDEIECEIGADGFANKYNATLTVTNNSGVPVKHLLFPGTTVDPNIITLDPILADGDSTTINVQFCDLEPGMLHCVDLVMADANVDACCTLELCFETPECDCMIFDAKDVTCDSTGDFDVTITFVNLAAYTAEHVFLIVESPVGATVDPDYIDIAAVPQYGVGSVGPITVSGVGLADEVCIRVTTHAEDLIECCSEVTCIDVPLCPVFDPCDIDGDGIVGFNDLLLILSSWGPCGESCPADMNNDGEVNFTDLVTMLASWDAGG